MLILHFRIKLNLIDILVFQNNFNLIYAFILAKMQYIEHEM